MLRATSAIRCCFLLVGLLAAACASAQSYPVRPVRVIAPFTAGSAIDTLARVIGQKLADSWGQQMVIDNRVGANGIIGTEAAAKSPADGYTLYFGNISTLAVNPHLYSKLAYDPVKDFEAVSLTASIPVVLVVHPSLPAKSVKEL
ncbi:MAG: tripartite tricarboxylate transporter substrate-binding protein, partial [Pseudomonadota bacterium]